MFTLPEEYRPSGIIPVICQGSGTNIWTLLINPDGTVSAYRYRNGPDYSNTPPGTNTWFIFHAKYTVD